MKRPLLLVTGGRTFDDYTRVACALNSMYSHQPAFAVVQGGARGADALAHRWCLSTGVPCIAVPANWDYYGKRAGGLRNQWMLDYLPIAYVVAFPGGPGTADMVRRARAAGVPVHEG